MSDIRDLHQEIRNQEKVDFEGLKWYAFGEQVWKSLKGREPEKHEFLVVEESAEEMTERGFKQQEQNVFQDSKGYTFYLAEENQSLEGFLRRQSFTIQSIAMSPGEQDYHFPFLNNFEEDEVRPEQPINPVKDLDNNVLRHTEAESFTDNFALADFAARLPEFDIAEETIEQAQLNAPNQDKNTLEEKDSPRYWQVLMDTNTLHSVFPALTKLRYLQDDEGNNLWKVFKDELEEKSVDEALETVSESVGERLEDDLTI